MKGFLLALMLTLVGCQHLNYQPGLGRNKCHTYNYEFKQLTGIPEKQFSSAGIKLSCKVAICGVSPAVYRIRMYSVEVFEYNGNSPGPELHFVLSPGLTKKIRAQLDAYVAFQHKNGRAGKFMAPANYSVDALNIYRGCVDIMQLTVKDKQREYTLQEAGIGGVCNTTYTIPDSNKANRILVMKAKNLNDCSTKVEKFVGATYATPCKECKLKNKNSQHTITSTYSIKPTQEEAIIEQADILEIHQFTPFNDLNGGSIVTEARQKLQLIKVEEHRPEALPADLKDWGSLAFQFSDEPQQLPTPIKQLERQIVDDLQYLAEHTSEKISRDCTRKFQHLVQIMHKANYDLYDVVYKKCSGQPACRRIFWDVVASADNPKAIRFLKHKFEQKEITDLEAAQLVIVSYHYSSPTPEVIEEAKLFLRVVHQHPHTFLFRTAILAYSALCHKYCTALNVCPESALQPVNHFASEVLSGPNEDNIILLLRSYENLQHPSIFKPFLKFVPGYATSDFSLRVQHVAVLCLKSFAKIDPAWVRSISMQIILNHNLHYTDRIFAVWSLLSTKPGLPTLTILAKAMSKEPSAQVEYFVISSMKELASSTAPDLQAVASACRMALLIVSSNYEWPKYRDSRLFLFSFYKESLMAGVTTEVFILNYEGSILPRFMLAKAEATVLGNKFSPLEVGVGTVKLPEILGRKRHNAGDDHDWSVDARNLLKTRADQKVMPHEAPLVGGYVKMFEKNIISGTIELKEVSQELYRQQHSLSWISKLVDGLHRGAAIEWVKAFTSVDASYTKAMCTGIPVKRSLNHVAITNLAGNAQARFTPELPPNPQMSDFINADISIKAKLDLSINKHMIFWMGIQNSLLEAGLEQCVKLAVNLPINAAVSMNIKKKSFKLEVPPCKEETNVFSLSSRTYTVLVNVDEEPNIKSTPVLPPEAVPNIVKQSFDSDSSSEESNKSQERKYSKTNVAGRTYSSGQHAHQSLPVRYLQCFDARTFGYKTCIKYYGEHAGDIKDVPLYYFVGDQSLTWDFYSVQPESPVEKIQATVQLGGQAVAQMVRSVRFGDQKADRRSTDDRARMSEGIAITMTQKFRKVSSSSSSSESASSSASSSDEDENNNKRPQAKKHGEASSPDRFSGEEAERGQRGMRRSQSPKKSERSSSSSSSESRGSSKSSSSSSSSSSSESRGSSKSSSSSSSESSKKSRDSSSSSDSSSSDSSSSDSSSSSSSSNDNQHKGREKNVKDGRTSSPDHAYRGDAERRHHKAPLKQQSDSSSSSSSNSNSSSESGWSYQKEKRQLKRPASKSGRTYGKDRAPYYSNDYSGWAIHLPKPYTLPFLHRQQGRNQEELRRSSSSSESSSSESSDSSQENNFLGDTVPPSLTVVVQAVSNDRKKRGYQTTVYAKQDANKLDVQLVMVELDDTKWNTCLYIDVCPYEAQAILSTGKRCQDKKLQIKASKGHLGRYPALEVKMKSKQLPATLRKPASMALEHLPGLAFSLGFNSIYQKNPSDEFVLRVAASSPQSVHVVCKVPGETLYKEGLYVPWASLAFPPQHYSSEEMTAFNFLPELGSRILRGDEAVCQVEETSIVTFDDLRFNGSFNENCRTLITQECTENPQFSIITRKSKPDLPREVYIHTTAANITISPDENSSLHILINTEAMLRNLYEDSKADIRIYRNESTVVIEAPKYGLENVTYDCETLWVTVSSWMRSKTCGLCGNNDGEKRNEGHMPNHELAYNDKAFFHSWLLEDSDCVTGSYEAVIDVSQRAEQHHIME